MKLYTSTWRLYPLVKSYHNTHKGLLKLFERKWIILGVFAMLELFSINYCSKRWDKTQKYYVIQVFFNVLVFALPGQWGPINSSELRHLSHSMEFNKYLLVSPMQVLRDWSSKEGAIGFLTCAWHSARCWGFEEWQNVPVLQKLGISWDKTNKILSLSSWQSIFI